MRLLALFFISIIFLGLSALVPTKVFADTNILYDKSTYSVGEDVKITISTIPYKPVDGSYAQGTYSFVVFPQGGSAGSDYIALVTIRTTVVQGSFYICRWEFTGNQDIWKDVSCTPDPSDGTQDFTFKGTLIGSKIGADENSTVDMFYNSMLKSSITGNEVASSTFVIKAPKQSTSFIINKITSNGINIYTHPGPATANVAPGAVINITFSPAINGTRYVWGKHLEPNNPSGICTVSSFSNQCQKQYTIPANTSFGQFIVDVLETGSNKLAQASIMVGSLTPNPTGLGTTGAPTIAPTNTPTPTPKPPRPPCAEETMRGGEFVGCNSVYTGLGISLNTDPARFIQGIFSLLLGLSGGIAILLIIRAGYKLMTSQGDPERVKEAREVLTSAIIGLLFLIFSLVILEVIGVDILKVPGFNR